MPLRRTLALAAVCSLGLGQLSAQTPKDFAVMLSATVSTQPVPRITLRWNSEAQQEKVYIYRKVRYTSNFTAVPLDSIVGTGTTWTDQNVEVGQAYEYRVLRFMPNRIGAGYLASGIAVPPAHRERILLLVDSTMTGPLAADLDRLTQDLENEGWEVTQRAVPRAERFDSTAVRITRDVVRTEWNAGPRDIGGILLIGRVAVPYSGNIVPDGHPDHQGAWPADGIYGDPDGNYTDNLTTSPTTVRAANRNAPRDGKFDQSQFSTDIEIPVGRIDFYNLPVFSLSETELLQRYLAKNHAYRTNGWDVTPGGIIDDNFGFFTQGEAFAASGWRNLSVFGGDTAVRTGDWFGDFDGPATYQWAYGCGGGTDVSAGGIGTSTDMATKPVNAVFTLLFGSYFGDYDTKDNFLRSALASQPKLLTCGWSGRPHWFMHHMAMGETVGFGARLSQNNRTIVGNNIGNYISGILQTAQGSSIISFGDRMVHIALMGDPTLRIATRPVATLGTLTASTEFPNLINLSWVKPIGDVQAYMVYRRRAGERRWRQLTDQPITTTSYRDSLSNEGTLEYMVRCCALRQSASGTFYDMGKGRVASVITTGVAEAGVHTTGTAAPNVSAAPNPASADLTVHVGLPIESTVDLSLVDLRGITVWNERLTGRAAGDHVVALDVSTLPAGSYTLVVRSADGTSARTVQVTR